MSRSAIPRVLVHACFFTLLLLTVGAKSNAAASIPGAAGDGVVSPVTGTYAATLKIEVPDYYNLEPDLALLYNSTSAQGFPGVGWSLRGESFFQRANANGGPPNYTSTDTFILDGTKLLPCTTLGGTHCAQNQSYQRITQDSANRRWYVWEKDGTRKTYIPVQCIVSCASASFTQIFRWGLSTIEDTHGNTVTYNYWCETGQNCYLDNISYNGYVVKFWREVRPDPILFNNGSFVGYTHFRLKTIQVSVGGQVATAYRLNYSLSGLTGRSMLASVQEFGTDASIGLGGPSHGLTRVAGKCIEVSGSSTANGANIQQWDCNGASNQAFTPVSMGGGYYRLVFQHSNKCMDVTSSGTASGTNIQQYSCNGTNAQSFMPVSLGGGYYKLVSKLNTSMCVDVDHSGTDDGTNIQLWSCNGTSAQAFVLDGFGTILSGASLPPISMTYVAGAKSFATATRWTSAFSATEWNMYYSTMATPDVNGDGRSDVCGRGSDGIWCVPSTGTGFAPTALWSSAYSNTNGWADANNYTTITYPDLNADGRDDVCGRGDNGITCALSTGTRFDPPTYWALFAYSDANGWDNAIYYSTIRYPDLNGDLKPGICGRASGGLYCALNTGSSFENPIYWTSAFANDGQMPAGGWTDVSNYSTIQYLDLNRDTKTDVCGRSDSGIVCALSTGTAFGSLTTWSSTTFTDAQGWNNPIYYSSIQYADVNGDGDPDICGRGQVYVYCGLSNGRQFLDTTKWSTD